tara:strand:- start:60 stop:1085 length:1026 start_codon:yes stop_codon:yes gene_type:complete
MRIAINGFGRVGRNIARALLSTENQAHADLELVALNDLAPIAHSAHLLKYDSVYGQFQKPVSVERDRILIGDDRIEYLSEADPSKANWGDLNIDLVLECTGCFSSAEKSSAHLEAGAKRVLISQPASGVDKTIVFGVNHETLADSDLIISNASCTTNCLAPLAKVINNNFVITEGLMITTHAYTNDQILLDINHSDLFRARSAALSMIPTKTGAATAVGDVIPELKGKLDGMAIRVPTPTVSLLDFTFLTEENFEISELDEVLEEASASKLRNILDINNDPLVSADFRGHSASCIYDKAHTRKTGSATKVLAWYDNEWAFSNRMLDVAMYVKQNLVAAKFA